MSDRQGMNITEKFLELVRLDSVSWHEQDVAAVVRQDLQELGLEVTQDETGNIYGILRGTASREPVLFSAHMDTVEPGIGKRPVLRDGRITSDGTTVLGADDVSGIVEILEGIRRSTADGQEHGDIEVLFTVAEEVYGQGAKRFDYSRLRSREAYVIDMSGTPGSAAHKAPSIISFEINVTGKAAHAGFAPETGVNALAAAGKAIARIEQGRVGVQTTLNIGTIQAGKADNIVPEACRCTGEVRSFDHEEALALVQRVRDIFEEEARDIGAQIEWDQRINITTYETPVQADVCREFQQACSVLGLAGTLVRTHGGSDNNIFAEHDIEGIVISSGMQRTHSVDEYIETEDLEKGAQLVAAIIRGRRGSDDR